MAQAQRRKPLETGAPEVPDATFWSLVASICLDFGLNHEGLRALEAAIALDPDNQALKSHRQLLSRDR